MYPEDVAALYPVVAVGAAVQVIYEPIKFGWAEEKCWIQVFDDFEERVGNPVSMVMAELSKQETATGPLEVDFKTLFRALKEKSGVPVAVARLAPE
jgi:L,D-transpeptidase ErfK/SrfK